MLGETADAVADYGSQKAAASAAPGSKSVASTNGAAAVGDSTTTLRRDSEGSMHAVIRVINPLLLADIIALKHASRILRYCWDE